MSEFYKELRVDNGLRKIGVNDKGDYLEISINDSSVFDRFADLMTWLQEKEKDLNQFQKDHAGEKADDPEVLGMYAAKRTETYQNAASVLTRSSGKAAAGKCSAKLSRMNY